jgi:hypothetical protein
MNANPYTQLWLTLISLFDEEDLIRWRKRVTLRMPECPARYDLMMAFDDELQRRGLLDQITVPPLQK